MRARGRRRRSRRRGGIVVCKGDYLMVLGEAVEEGKGRMVCHPNMRATTLQGGGGGVVVVVGYEVRVRN